MARILVLDPDGERRVAICEVIQTLTNDRVEDAASAQDALARLRRSPFDLVVIEASTAGFDAFEVCDRVRSAPWGADLPILLLTSSLRQQEVTARAGQRVQVLVQPVSDWELAARVRAMLKVARERRATDSQSHRSFEPGGADHQLLQEIMGAMGEGLLLVDAAGQVICDNPKSRRLLEGASGRELVAMAHKALLSGEELEATLKEDGRMLLVRARAVAGRRALVQVRDVTEEREREVRLFQAEKLASIGMLAAGVAHEINNPISFVLMNLDALGKQFRTLEARLKMVSEGMQGELTQILSEARAMVQESQEGAAYIRRIVRDLRSFSHVDDDAVTAEDVNQAVDSALSMLRNEIRYRARVERDLRASRPVTANAARLGQVFLNLIINAIQALERGSPATNRIWVRSLDQGDDVVVEVEDNGPGVPSEVALKIFDSFFTTKPRGVGTGLGLPISRGIVRSLGGELSLVSRPGRGALFRVRLPAAVAAHKEKTATVHELAPPPRRRRLLAVDDDQLLLKAYGRMFGDLHEVKTVLGARAALALLETDTRFDVILCDLHMPEMTGMDLFQEVQTRWPDLAERFIFVTGGAISAAARRFLDDPSHLRISKPFRVEELMDLMEHRLAS